MELFLCPQGGPHVGTVLVPLCKVVLFSAKKRLIMAPPLPFLGGKRLHSGAKSAPLLEKWYHFQPFFWIILENGSTVVPFWQMVPPESEAPFFLKHDY